MFQRIPLVHRYARSDRKSKEGKLVTGQAAQGRDRISCERACKEREVQEDFEGCEADN